MRRWEDVDRRWMGRGGEKGMGGREKTDGRGRERENVCVREREIVEKRRG